MQTQATATDGRHDFDFLPGTWRIENRKRVRPVLRGDDEWIEFEATGEAMAILGGLGNIDTFKAPDFPGRPGFEGFTLRLEEPVVGRFEDGLGRFECDDVVEGVPVRVRYEWKVSDPDAVSWEQLFSFDGGETWDSNWVMRSTRVT